MFSERFVPIGDRASYLVRRIFLDEVDALDGHLALIRPRAAVFALRSRENCAGVGVDEQLRRRAFLDPLRIAVGDRYNVGGFGLDWGFARARERRAPRLAL